MEELVNKLADLLDVESVDLSLKFKDYEEWDSFTRLATIAMLDKDYHIQMTYQELEAFATIEDFCKQVIK